MQNFADYLKKNIMKRMIESINMVRELLKSSKEMREKFDKISKKTEEQENEIDQVLINYPRLLLIFYSFKLKIKIFEINYKYMKTFQKKKRN